MLNRRQLMLSGLAAWLTPPLVKAAAEEPMPSLFFAHDGPFLARDEARSRQLVELVEALPRRPRGIVIFTPHLRAERMTMAASGVARRSFPRRFRKMIGDLAYAPPPADALAARVRSVFVNTRYAISERTHHGFNHTVWMGLIHMFPAADMPVVEVAMPFLGPADLFALGRALAPLRDEGHLVIASGSLTHNLATIGMKHTPAWAREFDQWVAETLNARDLDGFMDWRHQAPAEGIAHPDDGGHFNVIMFALGAAVALDGGLTRAISMHAGWESGAFTTRDYLFS